jgi:hypothetical protein
MVRLLMDLKAQQDRAAEAEDDEEEPDEEVSWLTEHVTCLMVSVLDDDGICVLRWVVWMVRLLMDLKAQQDRAAEAEDGEEEPDEGGGACFTCHK